MIEPLLEKQLDPVVRRHRCWRRWRGWILGWGGVALVGLGFIGLKHLFGIGAAVVAPVLVLAALVVTVAVWFRNAAWSPDYREIARRIERQHPELHALLLTAVEQRPNPATGRLDYLQQRVVDEAIAQSARHQWLDAVPAFRIWALRGAWLTVAAGFGAVLWSLWTAPAGPGLRASLFRGTAVTVQPGDAEVERGSGVIITARFEGAVPGEVTLVIGTGSNELQRLPMVKSLDDPVFGGSLTEVSSNLTYRVAYAGTQSEDFHLRVFEHPSLKRADAHLEFPDYTGLAKKTIENTRRVSAVEGSQLELVMELNKPVVSARLVGKDKSVVPLVVETNKPQVALRDFALTASQTYELHLVDADGRTNKVPAQFVLEALKNRKPELKFLAPRGDQKVSPIEEMNFQGEAWDDFGLRGYGLAYTVAGSETVELRLGTNAAPGEKKTFGHLLSLETLKLVPDQLISYYLWAEDVGPDGQLRRSASDMFFAEVRALDEIFREGPGQQSEGEEQQGGGNQATRLAELQKEIINATWKLQRQETGAEPSASYKEDARVVADSQEQALAQAEAMQSMTQDPRAQVLLESVTEAMDKALKHLVSAIQSTASLPPALQAEQAAYQALLKLSQHEYLVSRSRSRGRQGQAGQNQGQLDQLDLKQSEDRYETQSQAAPQQSAEQREQMQVQNRLKELARRQQDLNERIKELQTALQEAKTDAERAEIERRLKRLREEQEQVLADVDELRQRMDRPENQSRMAEAREQLERTRREVQRAAESLERGEVSQALAEGTRAQRELQQLQDDFRKKNSSQFAEEMRQMRHQARELAQNQENLGQKLDELARNQRKSLSDSDETRAVTDQFNQQRAALTNLLSQVRDVSDRAEVSEPLLARQLYDTLRKASQDNTENSLNLAQELLRRNFKDEAGQFEQRARQEINELKRGIEHAAESVLGDDTEALRRARRELDSLSEQLNREIQQNAPELARGQPATQPGATNNAATAPGSSPAQAETQPGDRPQQEGAGRQPAEDGRAANQQAQQGAGQEGQRGGARQPQPGQGQGNQPAGQQSQQAPQPGQGQQADQQAQQAGQQPGEGQQQTQANQQGQRGQQGQSGQPGQQGQGQAQARQNQQPQQAGQGRQPNQQAQTPGQQPVQQAQQQGQQPGQGQQGQPNQQAQQGQGQQGQGTQPGQQPGQRGMAGREPGDQQAPQQARAQERTNQRRGGRNQTSGSGGDSSTIGQESFRNFFDENGREEGPAGEGPLTGAEYSQWADRLREVEELIDLPDLRNEVVRARERARQMRADFKRHGKAPQWDLVQAQISEPLAEVRRRVAEELARRESNEALVPIDRDPVPQKYSDLVRRYYEKLGGEDR